MVRAQVPDPCHATGRYFVDVERKQVEYWGVPVAKSCTRLVNGIVDSNMDPVELAKLAASEAHRGLGVAEQMTAGHYAYIEQLRARRFPIVDETRGLVLAHVMFDHPGDLKRTDGAIPMKSPNSMLAYEAFKIRSGVLTEVWAIGGALPYGIGCGWSMAATG